MVKDAEAHAEEDKKFHELVSARNHADSMVHATEKSLKEIGDKVSTEEKESITKATDALKEALKGSDKAEIERATEVLAEASGKMAERLYAANPQPGAPGESGFDAGAEQPNSTTAKEGSQSKDDVVDAEFEEVKENKN